MSTDDAVQQALQAARAGVAATLAELGIPDTPTHSGIGIPEWVQPMFDMARSEWAAGRAESCEHVEQAQNVHAAAWKPGLIACAECHVRLLELAAKLTFDRNCDRCGRRVTNPEERLCVHRFTAGNFVFDAIACSTCLDVQDAPNSAHSGTV